MAILTREQDEELHGALPPAERSRRWPVFYASEVELIRSDPRSSRALAKVYNVSPTTITSVLRDDYIARDRVERKLSLRRPRPDARRKQRNTIPEELHEKVRSDPRSSRAIAEEYDVSVAYIYKIRNGGGAGGMRMDK